MKKNVSFLTHSFNPQNQACMKKKQVCCVFKSKNLKFTDISMSMIVEKQGIWTYKKITDKKLDKITDLECVEKWRLGL